MQEAAGSPVDIADVMKDAWVPFKSNLALTLGIPFILCVVPFVVVGIPAGILAFLMVGAAAISNHEAGPATFLTILPLIVIASVCFAVVYNAIRVGWTKVLLEIGTGEPAQFSDLTKVTPWLLNFIVVNFLIGIATAIGALFLLVPGIFIGVRAALAPYLVIDENLGPIEAIKKSNELVTGYSWQVLIYFLLYGAANLIVSFIPIIGTILPIGLMGYFDMALTKIYLLRKPNAPVAAGA